MSAQPIDDPLSAPCFQCYAEPGEACYPDCLGRVAWEDERRQVFEAARIERMAAGYDIRAETAWERLWDE